MRGFGEREEAGCGDAPPAFVDAVAGAFEEFGVRHIDMPPAPERDWRALDARTPS